MCVANEYFWMRTLKLTYDSGTGTWVGSVYSTNCLATFTITLSCGGAFWLITVARTGQTTVSAFVTTAACIGCSTPFFLHGRVPTGTFVYGVTLFACENGGCTELPDTMFANFEDVSNCACLDGQTATLTRDNVTGLYSGTISIPCVGTGSSPKNLTIRFGVFNTVTSTSCATKQKVAALYVEGCDGSSNVLNILNTYVFTCTDTEYIFNVDGSTGSNIAEGCCNGFFGPPSTFRIVITQ